MTTYRRCQWIIVFWTDYCARRGSGVVRERIANLQQQAASARARVRLTEEQAFVLQCRDIERKEGLSEERCRWNKCERPALRASFVCATHRETTEPWGGDCSRR